MKNKKRTITFLLCMLLPTALYGMKVPSKILKPIKTTPTTPIIRQPQPKIELPTTEPTIQQPLPTLPKPKITKPSKETQKYPTTFTQPSKTKPFELFKTTTQRQTFISPKDRIDYYKTLAEEAQNYGLKNAKYNPKTKQYEFSEYNRLIQQIEKKIEQAEDFTETETVDIAETFNVLQAKLELKELTVTLDDLMMTAKELNIPNQNLEKFKKLDIDYANDILTIDIFKEKTDQQIAELKDLIKKTTEQKATRDQGPTEKDFEDETEQEKIARESREAQEKTQKKPRPKKINLPKEIKESPLQEFRETIKKEQLKLTQEAAEQEAAEEQARLKAEKLQKEVDELYEELDKQFDKEQQAEQERITLEAREKEIEQEQERAVANKIEQQKLLDAIAENKTQLEEINSKIEKIKSEKEERLKVIQEKINNLALEIDKEEQAHAIKQKIESAQRKQELKEVKTERQRAERKARKAEQKAQEEQKKIDDNLTKSQQEQSVLQAKKESLAKDAEAIKELEAKLDQLKNKHQSTLQAMNEAKSQFTQQKQEIETKAQTELDQLNQETVKKIQEAKDNLQKSKSFIAKDTAEQIAELEVLEKKYQEEATIQRQSIEKIKNEQSARISSKYEQELRLIESLQQAEQKEAEKRTTESQVQQQAQLEIEQLENAIKADELAQQEIQRKQQELLRQQNETQQDITTNYEQEIRDLDEQLKESENNLRQAQEKLNAEKAKAEERERQKREQEERERREREKKAEGSGDGRIPDNAQREPSQEINPKVLQEENGNTQPNTSIPFQPQEPLVPIQEETKTSEAAVLPQTTPEIIPTQPTEEPKLITEEPIGQTIEQPIEQAYEQTSPTFTGQTTGTTPRWPTSPSSSYTSPTKNNPFTPSLSSGAGTSPTTESIGWTSPTSTINPYTQRIEWQKNFAPKEGTTAAETKIEKKAQPQDKVWWEKILPQWVVQYLGRKDRIIKEQPTAEKPTPITAPEEQTAEKPKTGIVQTFIETIKKPINNTINFIRGLFYG